LWLLNQLENYQGSTKGQTYEETDGSRNEFHGFITIGLSLKWTQHPPLYVNVYHYSDCVLNFSFSKRLLVSHLIHFPRYSTHLVPATLYCFRQVSFLLIIMKFTYHSVCLDNMGTMQINVLQLGYPKSTPIPSPPSNKCAEKFLWNCNQGNSRYLIWKKIDWPRLWRYTIYKFIMI
jgi:hypothetical protein